MAEYRLYLLDHLGHITDRIDLVFETDEQALAVSRERFPVEPIELWQGDRMVAHFPNVPGAGDALRPIAGTGTPPRP